MFNIRHHNRLEFPDKHIVVAEDDLIHQVELMTHLSHMFDRQGKVRVSLLAGGIAVAAVLQVEPVDLIILDFDMPYGNAADLIDWMVSNDAKTPIITASGWEPNLAVMQDILGKTDIPHWIYSKSQVITGEADKHIHRLLNKE